MNPLVEQLWRQRGAWLQPGQGGGIVVSSRIRLARNLKGAAFPGWAGEEECERIWREVHPLLTGLGPLQPGLAIAMPELDELDRQILFERHLISREQAEKGGAAASCCGSSEGVCGDGQRGGPSPHAGHAAGLGPARHLAADRRAGQRASNQGGALRFLQPPGLPDRLPDQRRHGACGSA
jgi:hypothetical protein